MTEAEIAWARGEFLRCKPWIKAALARDAIGTHDADDVWTLIEAGHAQIWPTPHAVMVTKIDRFPKATVLQWWLAGGNLNEILASEPRIRAWAKAQGCTFAAIAGRRGWARKLKDYRAAFTVMVRDMAE